MTRVNFLSAARSRTTVFGLPLATSTIPRALTFALVAALSAGLTARIEADRLAAFEAAARSAAAEIASKHDRDGSLRLVADRLLALRAERDRREIAAHSGNDVAAVVAGIGNALPATMSLESLMRQGEDFVIAGDAESARDLADALRSIGSGLPRFEPLLIASNAMPSREGTLHFTARLKRRGESRL